MAMRDQEVFKESSAAPGAEQMFADNPEMLALIAKSRASEARGGPPRRKPLWWQAFLAFMGLAWAAIATVPALLQLTPYHSVIPAAGLLGGMCLGLAILGHFPGRYIISDEHTREEEKATLWKSIPLLARLGALAIAFVAPVAAFGIVLLQ